MIKDINSFFEGFQQANSLKLVSHHWGDFWNAWSSRLLRYPNITTYSVTKGITNKKVDTYDVTVTISDMVRNDDSNLIDVENSTLQICRDVFDAMRVHFSIVNSSVSIRFFRQSGGDVVAGHTFVVTVQEVGKSNCGANMKLAPCRSVALFVNDVKIGDFINDVNLTLKDTQGNDVDFTVNGNDLVVNDLPVVCLDASYEVEYANGTPIESGTIPSGGSKTIIVPDAIICADATVTNGGAYSDTVASGGTLLLPTENITVNGNLLINKPSVEDYDVEVVDSDDNPTGVISGGKVVVADTYNWKFQFIDQTDTIQIEVDANMLHTFSGGSGVNIGTMEISTDGVNYTPITYPFTPTVGIYYFKRGTALITGTYTMIQ